MTTGGSYGAAEERSKNNEGRNVLWEFGEREENVIKIKIVWL